VLGINQHYIINDVSTKYDIIKIHLIKIKYFDFQTVANIQYLNAKTAIFLRIEVIITIEHHKDIITTPISLL
jgi:hypothetical protein